MMSLAQQQDFHSVNPQSMPQHYQIKTNIFQVEPDQLRQNQALKGKNQDIKIKKGEKLSIVPQLSRQAVRKTIHSRNP